MKKKYYDGFIVHDILDAHLKPGKMLEVLKAFAEVKGVDAVEVIRCKDCRYYEVYERKYDGSADKRFKPSICTRAYEYAVAKDPNWFCADAEPKEADG